MLDYEKCGLVKQAPTFRTLVIMIYCYHNLELVVMIAKTVQNILETTKINIMFLVQFLVTLLGLQFY